MQNFSECSPCRFQRAALPLVLVLASLPLAAASVAAQPTVPGLALAPSELDLAELIKETQKQSSAADELTQVWWMPEEFFWASAAADPMFSVAQTEPMVASLRPYMVVAVIAGKLGAWGGLTFLKEEEIRATLKVVDQAGKEHHPLPASEISADAKNFVAVMRPMLANLLGPMGENLHFYFFSKQGDQRNLVAEASKEGAFTVVVAENSFQWRLPIGSVLPRKICPDDGETVSGAWTFCPRHGSRLVSREPERQQLESGDRAQQGE